MRWSGRFLLLLMFLSLVIPVGAQDAQLRVVATTTILADVAQNVGGELVRVTSLLPPDTDTHAYEPTAEDAARVAQADMLLIVGAGYEAFLSGLLENAGSGVNSIEVSRGLEILPLGLVGHDHEAEEAHEEEGDQQEHESEAHLGMLGEGLECEAHDREGNEHEEESDEHEEGACDPHVWMNPQNVIGWVNNIADALSAADSANADAYRANADAYIAQLEALDSEIEQIVAEAPEDRRILVTNHEFMGYFADRYGFEVVATVLPGGTTGGEIDPQSLAALIALVQEEQVAAIFAEVSANPQIADVIAQESGVAVVTSLYSESLGDAESPASTYIDFMRYNAQTIADALSAAE